MARRSLKPQLNQIRTWVRQGRTDAWIAHQLEVSVRDISAFKSEHDLAPGETAPVDESDPFGARVEEDEPDLRAADEALVAAALEAELDEPEEEAETGAEEKDDDEKPAARGRRRRAASDKDSGEDETSAGEDSDERPARRRRGRRGGRGRGHPRKPLEGSFDHGEEGYGLWLDPAVQDDPIYAEHWAGHRPVTVTIEADRILISRAGEDADGGDAE